MRKTKIIALLIVCCTIISGCVSKSDYETLEKRVETLEKLLNEQNAVNTEKDDVKNEISAKEDNGRPETTLPHDDVANQESIIYSVDNMSEQEILEECNYYFNNLPFKGESYDEYRKTMKAAPLDTSIAESTYFIFTNDSYGIPDEDYIRTIRVDGIITQMDGTIGFQEQMPIIVNIELVIHKYEKAEKIYDLLYDQLSPMFNDSLEKESSVIDSRESTYWYAQGYIKTSDHSTKQTYYLSMRKDGDFYTINAQSYTKVNHE